MDEEELKRAFQMFDKNGDGKITKKDLIESLESLGIFIPEGDLAQMIEKFDVNGDDCVDFDEFGELYQSIMSDKDEDEDIKEAFKVFDQNGDGYISVDELGSILVSLGLKQGKNVEECERMIMQVDADGDDLDSVLGCSEADYLAPPEFLEKKSLTDCIVITEKCVEGESGVSEADKKEEEKVLIIESSFAPESGVSEVDKNKDKVLITENCAGDESELCELDLNQEPYEGMLFESVQAAKDFYDEYARRAGFLTRIISSRKSDLDGSIIHRRLACNKEGFNQNRQKSTCVRVRKRESKREGCMARMYVKQQNPGSYIISKFVKEHNHPLFVTSGKDQPYTDDKDKKIHELSSELNKANEELVASREQLCAFMTSIEEHTIRLSKTVEGVVQNIREVESRDDHSHNL